MLKRRLRFGFALAILLVLIVGGVSHLNFRKQIAQSELVNHTYKIISQAELMEKCVVDMETGRRGFRSTNDKKFLEPYTRGLHQVQPTLTRFAALANNEIELRNAVSQLQVQVNALLTYWASLGYDAEKYTRQDIANIQEVEKQLMDKVRGTIAGIMERQRLKLAQREQENRDTIRLAILELTIGVILILAIVAALIYQTIKEFNSRTNTEHLLKEKNDQLEQVNADREERNWLLTGLAEINNILHAHAELDALTNSLLQTIIQYMGVQAGAMYVYDEESRSLVLSAQYALPATVKKSYELGEGFVGQAATSKSTLVIDNLSPSQISLTSSTVNAVPAEAVFVPVYLEKELKGVIELLCLSKCADKNFELLAVITNNIGAAIHTVQSRYKVVNLYEQVQQQKEELEHQQEELRQVNEELGLQAEVLQTSEEELRVQEEELRQINAELEEKNEAVETARHSLELKTRELESISRYKSEFLANMSHELRTPLNSVLILAKLLADNADNNLTDKQVAHAKIIYKSGSDLLQLINDILDLSKIEAGKVDVVTEEVKVKELVNNMQQMFAMVAEEKNIRYELNIDADVPAFITSDRQKIEQVLRNLLSNAFKFTADKGSVTLQVSKKAEQGLDCISFVVADTGIGIAPGKQKLIFEAFQQADTSISRKYGGTGLGLSIISSLVKLLKGKVALDSEEGAGSRFTVILPVNISSGVSLPAQEVAAQTTAQAIQPAQVKEQSQIADDRNSIEATDNIMLIVEDDIRLAEVLKNYAASKNFKTIVALQGDEGLYYAKKYHPSVIILDITLPILDGNTILKSLKADPDLRHIPVHIISSGDENAAAQGALAFLQKPFNTEQLENAFTLIDEYLKSTVKRLLIISPDPENAQQISRLVMQKSSSIKISITANAYDAAGEIGTMAFDTIIADVTKNFDDGIKQLKWLSYRLASKPVPTIICIDEDITPAKELELKKISSVIVRKSLQSNNRLLDELDLFLYNVKEEKEKPLLKIMEGVRSNHSLGGKKVLVVDDDMRNVFALSAVLEKEDVNVITATDGREAIDILEHDKEISMVLMDIMMPELDGFEAMRIIRNKLRLTQLPIIALTAKAMAGDREKCIEAGASDYITKPVDVQKLVSLMRVWLA